MAKRMIITLAAVAAFLTAIGFIKFRQIQTAIAQASSFQPPPEAVTTVVTRQERWASTLSAIGTTAAVHGVTVSADLPGVVEAISFDSGRAVQAGVEVRVSAEGIARPFEGRITAVDSIVDEATRNVQAQATLPNREGRLRPGMFVQAEVLVGTSSAVVALPTSAVAYAPYGDSVFVVGDVKG